MPTRLLAFILVAMTGCLLGLSGLFSRAETAIWVLDVGQGDAIFIDGPERQILIDGGKDELVVERLTSIMPWWDRSIDILLNTHPHADHLVGLLPVMERYQVSEVIDAGEGYNTAEFFEYVSLADSRRRILAAGEVIELGGGARLSVLWPPEPYADAVLEDPNDGSIILLFELGDFAMLLTGDAGEAEELELLENDVDCNYDEHSCLAEVEILKVGHHGSDTSSSQALLYVMTPEAAIISVGQDNSYKHPSSFVVERLRQAGAEVYRTDLDGSVRIKIRQGKYRISTHRF